MTWAVVSTSFTSSCMSVSSDDLVCLMGTDAAKLKTCTSSRATLKKGYLSQFNSNYTLLSLGNEQWGRSFKNDEDADEYVQMLNTCSVLYLRRLTTVLALNPHKQSVWPPDCWVLLWEKQHTSSESISRQQTLVSSRQRCQLDRSSITSASRAPLPHPHGALTSNPAAEH